MPSRTTARTWPASLRRGTRRERRYCRRDDGLGGGNLRALLFAVSVIVPEPAATGQLPGALRFARFWVLADTREPLTADADNDTARLRRFIRDGLRELEADPHLSAVKRADSLKKLVDARVALDRSTGENALSMQRIVAHPEFQRVLRLITEAVATIPGALDVVIKALEAARG